ncbi:MAG TPA: MOSC domain-containing protein [Anaerolineales bacterium]|nr:MOSC domain-containing protein [Anaerolineales bacterium]
MQLISVNIGRERSLPGAKLSGGTGIYKLPVEMPVRVTSGGLPGDVICDTKHHGGPDQAVYVYGAVDYRWWSETLGYELAPGTFGENLTISELESARLCIGDILHIGALQLQVTSPRMPCVTLAARMGDARFIDQFRQAERPGLYCRVLQGGQVQVGAPVRLEHLAGETITILEMFRDYYAPQLSEARLRLYLAAPISVRARLEKEKQLHKLLEK